MKNRPTTRAKLLAALEGEWISGATLRQRVADAGVVIAGPNFYQLMRRMHAAGLVEVESRSVLVGGHRVFRENWYRLPHGSPGAEEAPK